MPASVQCMCILGAIYTCRYIMMPNALSKETAYHDSQKDITWWGNLYPSVPQKDYQDVPYSKVWSALMCSYCQVLGTRSVVKSSVGQWAHLLASLLHFFYHLCPPILAKLFLLCFSFFPPKYCVVWASQFFRAFVFYTKGSIMLEHKMASLYTLAFVDAFCNRMCYGKFLWKSLSSE